MTTQEPRTGAPAAGGPEAGDLSAGGPSESGPEAGGPSESGSAAGPGGPGPGAPGFHSILFPDPDAALPGPGLAEPPFFRDLNLDQIAAAVTAGREDYNLVPFFYAPLTSPGDITYRHEVLRDLERRPVLAAVTTFAQGMRLMRERLALAARLYYPRQQERWFLDAVTAYCDAVTALAGDLATAAPESAGLRSFQRLLADYTASAGFTSLAGEAAALTRALDEVRYTLHIRGNRVRVRRYQEEADYSRDVTATFAKFRQGDVRDHLVRFSSTTEMDHVEAGIADLVAKLYPETFGTLTAFRTAHVDHLDPRLAAFDREVQFYVSYLEYTGRLRAAGLPFCYPEVSADGKEVRARETFDLALAGTLAAGGSIVRNDFHLTGPERALVVTGPNQGGKTTLARTFGQLHHLARLGLPVPGTGARLYLCDQIFTHFEKEENLTDLSGKLQDDLVRIHDILRQASPASVVILNEIFTSTTLTDALSLGRSIMTAITGLDALCVCVTFLDELASLGPSTVSMVAAVDPADPAIRTYQVVRRPADGLAHAMAIAARHGLTYDQLRRRIAS